MYLIGLLIIAAVTVLVGMACGGAFVYFIDIPSICGMLLICIPVLLASGLLKDFVKAFKIAQAKDNSYGFSQIKRSIEAVSVTIKTLLLSGGMMSAMAILVVVAKVDESMLIGPNIAVALVSTFYGMFLSIILLPIKARLELKLAETMKEE